MDTNWPQIESKVNGGIQYDTYAPSASSYLGTGKHGPHRQLAVDPLWTTGAFTLVSPVILGEWVTDGRARQEHRKYSPVPWSTADGLTYYGAVAMKVMDPSWSLRELSPRWPVEYLRSALLQPQSQCLAARCVQHLVLATSVSRRFPRGATQCRRHSFAHVRRRIHAIP